MIISLHTKEKKSFFCNNLKERTYLMFIYGEGGSGYNDGDGGSNSCFMCWGECSIRCVT